MELLERGFACLQTDDWSGAARCFEQVLELQPGNPQAHMGKLMAELHARNVDELKNCDHRFDNRISYQNALPHLDPAQKAALEDCVDHIIRRNEQDRWETAYDHARQHMAQAVTEGEFLESARLFSVISGYEDAAEREKICRSLAEAARKDGVLAEAAAWMEKNVPDDYGKALRLLETVPGWKDADEKARYCKARLQQFRQIERREHQWKERMHRKIRKAFCIILPAAATVLALTVLTVWVLVPAVRYRRGVSLMDAGDVVGAYELLNSLQEYRDSEERAEEIYVSYKIEMLKEVQTGDYVNLGVYAQTTDAAAEQADINWLVLDRQGDRVLLLSRMGLEVLPFHDKDADVDWEHCTLRNWLNGTFCQSSFSLEERERISLTEHDGVQDRVFLLSAEEMEQYLPAKSDRWCDPTLYAVERGAWTHDYTGRSFWWLRSSAGRPNRAMYVGSEGTLQENGTIVDRDYITVRPAMWVELEN